MSVYCVSYDLNTPGQEYNDLNEELKNSQSWWHFLTSTWLIYTSESSQQLSDRLRAHLDDNDNLMVIRVTANYAGWLPEEAWEWMREHIR